MKLTLIVLGVGILACWWCQRGIDQARVTRLEALRKLIGMKEAA